MKKALAIILFLASAPSFAGYCFTTNKKINSCDPQKIQSMIDTKDNGSYGSVTIMEIKGSSLQTTIIYPLNAPAALAGKILVTPSKFSKTATSYEETDKDGCVKKGSFKESATTITRTPRALAGTCNSTVRGFFDMLKNSPTEYRKINN